MLAWPNAWIMEPGSVVDARDNVLGAYQMVEDRTGRDAIIKRSSGHRVCRVVKNGHASAVLLPGQTLTWKAGGFGTVVDAVAGANGIAAGVVDFWIPSTGVAPGKMFLMTIWGPTQVIDSGSGMSEGTFIKTAAAGDVAAMTADPSTAAGTTTQERALLGRMQEAVSADAKGFAFIDTGWN